MIFDGFGLGEDRVATTRASFTTTGVNKPHGWHCGGDGGD